MTEPPSAGGRDFAGIHVERREPGSTHVSIPILQFIGRSQEPGARSPEPATATMCERRPNDGRTHHYTARTFDAAGNYSPRGESVTLTVPRF